MGKRGRPPLSDARRERRDAERARWAERVRELRWLRGDETQAELAARLDCTAHAVAEWEASRSAPSRDRQRAILLMLDEARSQAGSGPAEKTTR